MPPVVTSPEPKPTEREKSKKKETVGGFFKSLAIAIGIALIIRFVLLEAFKIPSGSMEPSLLGNPDHGDRIFVWKPVYWFGQPKRWEVVVFAHPVDDARAYTKHEGQGKSYIKRLVGLPGETIIISCTGDLYLRESEEAPAKLLRKPPELQASLWYPVARFPPDRSADLPRGDPWDEKHHEFCWRLQEGTSARARLGKNRRSLAIDAAGGPVALEYRYPVTNLYVRTGYYRFRVPAELAPPGAPEVSFRQLVRDAADGVRLPEKYAPPYGRRLFPLREGLFYPEAADERNGRRLYGGMLEDHDPQYPPEIVSDLRLVCGFQADGPSGVLELKMWHEEQLPGKPALRRTFRLGLGAAERGTSRLQGEMSREERPESLFDHPVAGFRPGEVHVVELQHCDAQLVVRLNGEEIRRVAYDRPPPGALDRRPALRSGVSLRFSGANFVVGRLDLWRDLHYMVMPYQVGPSSRGKANIIKRGPEGSPSGMTICSILEGYYLMLGDNSPSSSDSRVWGFVPQRNLVGKALCVWWPPSRWGLVH